MAQLHKPVNDTLMGMDFYLRRTESGFVKHDFVVYVEPLAAPGEINSRNYGDDYNCAVAFGDSGRRGWTRCGIRICTTFLTPR